MSDFEKDVMPSAENTPADTHSNTPSETAIPPIEDAAVAPEPSSYIEPPLQNEEFQRSGDEPSPEFSSEENNAVSQESPSIAQMIFQEDDFLAEENAAETSEITESESLETVQPIERDIEELTLAELVGQFWRAPRVTWQAFSVVIKTDAATIKKTPITVILSEIDLSKDEQTKKERKPFLHYVRLIATNPAALKLGLYLIAFGLALFGTLTLSSDLTGRTEEVQLVNGTPFLVLGILVWLIAEILDHHQALRGWWTAMENPARWRLFARMIALIMIFVGVGRLVDASDEDVRDIERILGMVAPGMQTIAMGIGLWLLQDLLISFNGQRRKEKIAPDKPSEEMLFDNAVRISTFLEQDKSQNSSSDDDLAWYVRIHPVRVLLIFSGFFLSIFTFFGSANNEMRVPGLWFASILCWSLAFAPIGWTPLKWGREQLGKIRAFRITSENRWVIVALIAIMGLGAVFRLSYLDEVPPQMTSDHVEKLLDSARIAAGSRDIFFANNGGREPFQMYAMAIFSQLPGQGINHHSLKLLAVLEGLLTLPVLFWFGREIMGEDNRRLGTLVGLVLAALVAASYWHTSVTRLALRIVLTPLMTALLLIYLSRAIRHNHRADFIKAGLVLGFGLYMYQAVRMLPVVIVVAIALAIYFGARNWQQRFKYGTNLAVLVLISFVVFIPMFRYSVENPDQFWRRTAGRLLGDDIITEVLPDGRVIDRYATLEERLYAFNQNIPVLLNNIRNALLMFNWKGDVAWINGVPNYPALDVITGAFFILGIGAWLQLMIQKRDIVYGLMPLILFIMLLPSALSIAYPVENPSFTRTSGALPVTFLLAAYPLALFIQAIVRFLDNQFGRMIAVLIAVLIVLGGYSANSNLYFTDFVESYNGSALPYTEAGQVLRGFAISDGAYGNAFMLAYRYWWDHRAVGLASGLETVWTNGVYDYLASDDLVRDVDYVPHFMRDAINRTDIFRLIPERDLLFFYSIDDIDTAEQLAEWFPQGHSLRYVTRQWGDDFMIYRVPALGVEGIFRFLGDRGLLAGT